MFFAWICNISHGLTNLTAVVSLFHDCLITVEGFDATFECFVHQWLGGALFVKEPLIASLPVESFEFQVAFSWLVALHDGEDFADSLSV